MKNVLYITYQFPPKASGGVFRSLYFIKHLQDFGWNPTVLTVSSKYHWAKDSSLLSDIPQNIEICRAHEFDTLLLHIILSKIGLGKLYTFIETNFFIPDKKIGWIPFAIKKGTKLIKKQNFDLIFSTSPTVSAHIIAQKLSQKFNIPWVCEFRDLWTLLPYYIHYNTRKGKIEEGLENTFITKSIYTILVTQTFRRQFIEKYPNINPDKFKVVYNGFEKLSPLKGAKKNKEFTIFYTGSMYGDYYPKQLYIVLNMMLHSNPNLKFKFIFIGPVEEKIRFKLNEFINIKSEFLGHISKSELLNNLSKADAFLLFQLGTYLSIPSKVFEYLSYRKPIFAIIQDKELRDIVNISGFGYTASPDSPDEIEKTFLDIYNNWKNDIEIIPKNETELLRFHRQNQCQQIAEIFNEVDKK